MTLGREVDDDVCLALVQHRIYGVSVRDVRLDQAQAVRMLGERQARAMACIG